jgi:hypothetical protein
MAVPYLQAVGSQVTGEEDEMPSVLKYSSTTPIGKRWSPQEWFTRHFNKGDYGLSDLERIDRHWGSLGRKIRKGARIK